MEGKTMSFCMEHHQISNLIREAMTTLCKNGLTYNLGFALEGKIQVLLDTRVTFEIKVNEVFGLTGTELISLKQDLDVSNQQVVAVPSSMRTGNVGLSWVNLINICKIVIFSLISSSISSVFLHSHI